VCDVTFKCRPFAKPLGRKRTPVAKIMFPNDEYGKVIIFTNEKFGLLLPIKLL